MRTAVRIFKAAAAARRRRQSQARAPLRPLLLVVALLLLAGPRHLAEARPLGGLKPAPAAIEALRPGEHATGLVELDTGVQRYRLVGLKPGASYEVRVSYPASIPAIVRLEWDAPPRPARRAGSARQLLDVEKLVFAAAPAPASASASVGGGGGGGARATGAEGNEEEGAPVVRLTAARRSPHRDGPGGGPAQLVYDIVVEELLLGVLPRDAVPVVAAAAALVALALAAAPAWAARGFPALLDWVLAAPGAPAAAAAAAVTTTAAAAATGERRRATAVRTRAKRAA